MQSYLGDYPGSRSNPEYKFKRSIESFLNQTYVDKELVIISDGCKITDKLIKDYLDIDCIKYNYLDNNEIKMYNVCDNKLNYRGVARQMGIDISSGDIISYLDSDDFLLETYLEDLLNYWDNNPNIDWIINRTWWENDIIKKNPTIGYYNFWMDNTNSESIKINGLDSEWVLSTVKDGLIVMSPALLSHKKICDVKWRNSLDSMVSEDQIFSKELRSKYPLTGGFVSVPGYVRCHLRNRWDF